MGNISAWVGVGLTALAMTAGCIAYIHALIGGVHTRISGARDWTEVKVGEVRTELKAEIDTERNDRRREYERFETILEGFRAVGIAVTRVADGVTHLGERFEDHRRSTDRSFDEIKHSMRGLDMKINALPGAELASQRLREIKETDT